MAKRAVEIAIETDEHAAMAYLESQTKVCCSKNGERLLEVAKRAVEIGIETDEHAAMAYLEQQT
ncbi:hypothetical protein [Methyloglobulus sp.]|uniref:hypothetical protein n=1 Tax=Methyloglobulus sp. TaxID=2518622 RepID=UPI0032B71C71